MTEEIVLVPQVGNPIVGDSTTFAMNFTFGNVDAANGINLVDIDKDAGDKYCPNATEYKSAHSSGTYDGSDKSRKSCQIQGFIDRTLDNTGVPKMLDLGFSPPAGFDEKLYTHHAALPVIFNFVCDGVLYRVNAWAGFAYNNTMAAYRSDTFIYQNWMTQDSFMPGEEGHVYEMLATAVSEGNKPCVLSFKTIKEEHKSGTLIYYSAGATVTFDRWINLEADDLNVFDQFNYKMASSDPSKRRGVLASNQKMFINEYIMPILTGYGQKELLSSELHIDQSSLKGTSYCDYVGTATLRNHLEKDQNMKSGDFEYTHQETTSGKISQTWKKTTGTSIKSAQKLTAKLKIVDLEVGGELSVETTVNAGFEYTDSREYTWTKQDTMKYTCPGQTVSVPANSAVDVIATWRRAKISGSMRLTYPLTDNPVLSVAFKDRSHWNRITQVNCRLNIDGAEELLGDIKMPKSTSNLTLEGKPMRVIYQYLQFQSDTGCFMEYDVKPHEEK